MALSTWLDLSDASDFFNFFCLQYCQKNFDGKSLPSDYGRQLKMVCITIDLISLIFENHDVSLTIHWKCSHCSNIQQKVKQGHRCMDENAAFFRTNKKCSCFCITSRTTVKTWHQRQLNFVANDIEALILIPSIFWWSWTGYRVRRKRVPWWT